MHHIARTGLLLALLLPWLGCSSSSDDTSTTAAATDTTAAATDTTEPDTLDSSCWDVDTYEDGIEKTGNGGLTFRLVRSELTPPDRGNNTFTVEVLENGAVRTDVTLVAEPSMPHHGHGTFPATFDGTLNDSDQYDVGPMDLFMSGRWVIEFRAMPAAGETETPLDSATFVFCLEG